MSTPGLTCAGRVGPAVTSRSAGRRPVSGRSRFFSDPAVPVVRRINVAARVPEILDHADALADPLLLPIRFCYYIHTAVFTFATPIIPLIMLIFLPSRVRLINYVFIMPSIVYNPAVFPAWHRCRFGPSAFMAKLLYGWAHVFDLGHLPREADGVAADRWVQAQGRNPADRPGSCCGTGPRGWSGSWSADCRGIRFSAFLILLATGLLACAITAMALLARRNYAGTLEGA